jgi:hypothetical protein
MLCLSKTFGVMVQLLPAPNWMQVSWRSVNESSPRSFTLAEAVTAEFVPVALAADGCAFVQLDGSNPLKATVKTVVICAKPISLL